jgi:hypothetical protein
MPEPIVRDDLAAGRLKRLDLPDGTGGFYCLEAIYRTDKPPGPAASWMIQRFAHQADDVESRRLPSPPREHRPLVARGRDSHLAHEHRGKVSEQSLIGTGQSNGGGGIGNDWFVGSKLQPDPNNG